MSVLVCELKESDREWVWRTLLERWGTTRFVTRGVLRHADELPGLVAFYEGERAGLLTYHVSEGELEVFTLAALQPGLGIGSGLMDAARDKALRLGCKRMWLVTTNDNEPAQRFYHRWGMRLVAIHSGALERSRQLKPEIPLVNREGTPILDEYEYELVFQPDKV